MGYAPLRRLFRFFGLGAAAWGAYRLASGFMSPRDPAVALQAGYYLTNRRARVLAVGPHPGDVEFFAGGTLLQMSRAGSHIWLLTASRGEQGGRRRDLAEIRTREAEKAAAMLGARRLYLGDFPDGGLAETPELARLIERVWRTVRPEVVLTFDPSAHWPFSANSDHVALGTATLETARRHLSEGVQILLYAPRHPNLLVDTTEVEREKQKIVRAHRSQVRGPSPLFEMTLGAHDALGRGTAPVRYVERFYRLA